MDKAQFNFKCKEGNGQDNSFAVNKLYKSTKWKAKLHTCTLWTEDKRGCWQFQGTYNWIKKGDKLWILPKILSTKDTNMLNLSGNDNHI